MATINLTSDKLKELAMQLVTWKNQISTTAGGIKSTVHDMQGWNDPQFVMFKNAVCMTENQLRQYCDSMDALAKILSKYATDQNDAVASFGANMNTITTR